MNFYSGLRNSSTLEIMQLLIDLEAASKQDAKARAFLAIFRPWAIEKLRVAASQLL